MKQSYFAICILFAFGCPLGVFSQPVSDGDFEGDTSSAVSFCDSVDADGDGIQEVSTSDWINENSTLFDGFWILRNGPGLAQMAGTSIPLVLEPDEVVSIDVLQGGALVIDGGEFGPVPMNWIQNQIDFSLPETGFSNDSIPSPREVNIIYRCSDRLQFPTLHAQIEKVTPEGTIRTDLYLKVYSTDEMVGGAIIDLENGMLTGRRYVTLNR